MKNFLNLVLEMYKILNKKIIATKNSCININKNDKNELIEINKLLKNEIKEFYNSQNIKEIEDNLNKEINKKELDNEINNLKEQLSRYPLELLRGEKLISVIFTSSDQNMYYSIICKNSQIFIELEQKLYNYYPEYSGTYNYFIVNGNRVNKYKSLDENKIRNNDIIILTQNKK